MADDPDTVTYMAKVQWKLKAFLDSHGITPYQLGKELGGQTRMPNIYRIINGEPSRVDLNMLGSVIEALAKLTGTRPSVCDLLEYEE